MKLHAITFAIALAGIAGTAFAGNHGQSTSPVTVSGAAVSACTPPADALDCEGFHRAIRANFSDREVGMLFGARTSYPQYRTGGIDRLQKRYQAWLQDYVVSQQAASAGDLTVR